MAVKWAERCKSSPMPFGSQSCEDSGLHRGCLLHWSSPMPFGSQSCEDIFFLEYLQFIAKSPMPFGSQSCEDTEAELH